MRAELARARNRRTARADRRTPPAPPGVAIVRAAADDGLARMEQHVQHRLTATATARDASAFMSSERRVRRPQPPHAQRCRVRAGPAWSCTAAARARRGTAAASAAGDRGPPTPALRAPLLDPGSRGAVVGQEVRRRAAPRRNRVRPCAPRRRAARRSTRRDTRAARARPRGPAEKPKRPDRYETGRAPTASSMAAVSDSSCRSNCASGSVRGVRMAPDVLGRARRRLPRMMVRADLAVAAGEQLPQDLRRPRRRSRRDA